jgi:hypothetical protein
MSQTSILGLFALALGAVLLFFAWRASNAPVDQMAEVLTGRYTDNTNWLIAGGVIGVFGGAALIWRGMQRS